MSRRSPTRFVFVRHGETDWNRRPRFRGVGRVLVCSALGISLGALWKVPQHNAAVSLFHHDGRTTTAVTINDVAHLGAA